MLTEKYLKAIIKKLGLGSWVSSLSIFEVTESGVGEKK